jgi:ATP-binding cassette subfamily B (MDR/TAP) protein 10
VVVSSSASANPATTAPPSSDPPARVDDASRPLDDDADAERARLELDRSLRLGAVIARVARRRWPLVLLAAFAMFAATSAVLASPLFSSKLLECLVGQRASDQFPKLLAGLGCIYCVEPLITFVYVKCVCTLGEDVVAHLRRDLFRALLVQRVAFFDAHETAELAATLNVEIGAVRQLCVSNVSRDRGFRAAAECLGTLLVLFVIAPALAPVLGFAIVSFASVTAAFNRKTGARFAADGAAQGAVASNASATFSAVRTVRSFGGETAAFRSFAKDAETAKTSGLRLSDARAGLEMANRGCIYVSLATLYAYGGHLVRVGAVPAGSLFAAVGFTFGLIFATQGVVNTLADAKAAVAALGRARELVTAAAPDVALARLLEGRRAVAEAEAEAEAKAEAASTDDISNDISDDAEPSAAARRRAAEGSAAARSAAREGDVVFRDVDFSYPSRPDAKVLDGLNLVLRRGKVTALVGASGAGKSTVAQLLCRFYEPDAGEVSVGGVPMRDAGFDRADWLDAVALVGQEPTLFAGTIGENVRYGRAGDGPRGRAPPTDEEVESAARAANADAFARDLPGGYDAEVGERGGRLSGGQRQRVAIARAVLKDAPVLILDEATSALDAASEAAVQAALETLAEGRTTLVVAHRLSTVQRADVIAVMDRGRVVESGSHEELLRDENGAYYALVNSQRLSFA